MVYEDAKGPRRERPGQMTPVASRATLVAYLTARRAGPTPVDPFLALFPQAGDAERERLVSLNAELLRAEMAGADMDAVFDEAEVRIGAELIREIELGIRNSGSDTP